MQINSIPINHPRIYFRSKNPDTKIADQVMRNARNEFSSISPSYIYYFYKVPKNNRQNFLDDYKAISQKLENLRNIADEEENNDIFTLLELIKEKKVANCNEMAFMSVAALCANGYYNSKIARIGLEIEFFDKNLEKPIYKTKRIIDHTVALSDLNNEKRKKDEDLIIIDCWQNFAGSYSKACEIYKNIFQKAIGKATNEAIEEFAQVTDIEKSKLQDENYQIRGKLIFKTVSELPKSDLISELSEDFLTTYPKLKIKTQNENNV